MKKGVHKLSMASQGDDAIDSMACRVTGGSKAGKTQARTFGQNIWQTRRNSAPIGLSIPAGLQLWWCTRLAWAAELQPRFAGCRRPRQAQQLDLSSGHVLHGERDLVSPCSWAVVDKLSGSIRWPLFAPPRAFLPQQASSSCKSSVLSCFRLPYSHCNILICIQRPVLFKSFQQSYDSSPTANTEIAPQFLDKSSIAHVSPGEYNSIPKNNRNLPSPVDTQQLTNTALLAQRV